MLVSKPVARAIVFLASAAVLVLEILAGRLMAPFVGVSLETFTGIIGTVLAGIAVGNAIGGRMADRRDPIPLIASAFGFGGILAWVSIPAVATVGPHVSTEPPAIVLLAAAAFFAPAAVLSAIGPMVAKIQLSTLAETGSVVGDLSATATIGALFGTFFTGFVLVASLPTRATIVVLGSALIATALTLTMGSRKRPPAAVIVVALIALTTSVATSNSCDVETAYSCVRIVADERGRPAGRSLFINYLRNSYVDLEDPTYLEFRYMRLFGDAIDALDAGPLTTLHVGGAGFTMPGYVEATRPGSNNLVLEIDGGLVDLAERELGLVLGPLMQVIVGDARLTLDDLVTDGFDLIIGDAFSDLSVPWHLTTAEVIAEFDRLLKTEGIYVMNVIDGGENRFARAELATLARYFDHVAFIVPTNGVPETFPVNQIIMASDAPLPELTIDIADGRILIGSEIENLISGVRILTDDFAPVDHLTLNS